MDLWEHFFRRLVSFLHLTAAREDGATQDVAEATVLKLDSFVSVLEAIRQTILDSNRQDRDLLSVAREDEKLRTSLVDMRNRWIDIEVGIQPRPHVLHSRQHRSGVDLDVPGSL